MTIGYEVELRELIEHPSEFRILRKITPYHLQNAIQANLEGYNPNASDIIRFCIMDFETTGFKHGLDVAVEIGLIKLDFSPSQGKLRLVKTLRQLEDPGFPLPEVITQVTGLTDDMLEGQEFIDEEIADFLKDCQVMIAHNAAFDRKFFDIRFPELSNMRWGCSVKDVDWYGLGFESAKLEYLLIQHRHFYEGHNALNDCNAMVQLFLYRPQQLAQILEAAQQPSYKVKGFGIPFEQKDVARESGFQWDPKEKVWHITCKPTELQVIKDFLEQLPGGNPSRNVIEPLAPEVRYA